jgi:hypothetical protein
MRKTAGVLLAAAFISMTASAQQAQVAEAHRKLSTIIALPAVEGRRYHLVAQADPCVSHYREDRSTGKLINWRKAERVEFMPVEPGKPVIWKNWVLVATADGPSAFHPVPEQVGPVLQAANELIRACKTAPAAGQSSPRVATPPKAATQVVVVPPCPPTRAALATLLAPIRVVSDKKETPTVQATPTFTLFGDAGENHYDPASFSILGVKPNDV